MTEWDEGFTKDEWFDLTKPMEHFDTYEEFEMFIGRYGIGYIKDDYEDFIEWCADKYMEIYGEDIFEKM